MSENPTLELDFGPLADDFDQQLSEQGLDYSGTLQELIHLDQDRDALSRLSMRGLIPDNVADKARLKLMGKFKGKVKPIGEK